MDRRSFLGLTALAVAGLACDRRAPGPLPPFVGVDVGTARHGLQIFLGGQEFIASTTHRISMGLVDDVGGPIDGGGARAWIGTAEEGAGPFAVSYRRYGAVSADATGFYVADLPLPPPGVATLMVEREGLWGTTVLQTSGEPTVPGPGQAAIAVKTPTFGDARGVANLCTRDPECAMHDQRLDKVLGKRPVVLSISSPKFCSSRTCGPVVDEVLAVRDRYGDRAAFIHTEVFATDGPQKLAPTSTAWKIDSEPWTFIIDPAGNVAARIEGPVVAQEIETRLTAVLG